MSVLTAPQAVVADATRFTEPEAISLWLASVYRRSGSDRTIEAYRAALARFRRFCPAPLADVTLQDAVRYGESLQESGLAASSQAQAWAAMRSLFRFLEELGFVARSPFRALPSPRVSTQGAPRMVQTGDLRAMLSAANPKQRAVVLLLATTALRVEEACAATWADVYRDLDGNTGLRVVGKGGKARDVKLLPRVLAALEAAVSGGSAGRVGSEKSRTEAPASSNPGREGYLLPMRTRQAVDKMLARLCRKAGVPHLSAHHLRHFAGTTALLRGASLMQVRDDLGHASIQTTSRYLHAAQGLKQTSADYVLGALEE